SLPNNSFSPPYLRLKTGKFKLRSDKPSPRGLWRSVADQVAPRGTLHYWQGILLARHFSCVRSTKMSSKLPAWPQVPSVTERRYKVLIVCGHPVQYMSPLLRRMAEHPRMNVRTAYCRLRGAQAGVDPEFGAEIQ